MSKMYYIKHEVIVQAERMREKLLYRKDIELYDLFEKGDYKEYEIKENEILGQLEELQDALDNVTSDRGCYNHKAEWKHIEILKKYASQRNLLDSFVSA